MPIRIIGLFVFFLGTMLTAAPQDSARVSNSGIDTIVVISARDSAHFSLSKKTLRLRGTSDVKYRTQHIEADLIIMDFNSSTMAAEGAMDSSGVIKGFPVFTDAGEEFAGESMTYNFSTGKGRVKFGETSVEGGFYYGSRIKRVDEKTAFVENGCFTTCDAAHPHFYFNSPTMKVSARRRPRISLSVPCSPRAASAPISP